MRSLFVGRSGTTLIFSSIVPRLSIPLITDRA
jgi:hypothetical protein